MLQTQPTYLKVGAHRVARFTVTPFSHGHIINCILPVTLVWRDGRARQRERE
jgi:hypothetical protein